MWPGEDFFLKQQETLDEANLLCTLQQFSQLQKYSDVYNIISIFTLSLISKKKSK